MSLGGKGLQIAILLWGTEQGNYLEEWRCNFVFIHTLPSGVEMSTLHVNTKTKIECNRFITSFTWEDLSVPTIICLIEIWDKWMKHANGYKTECLLKAPGKAGLC